MYIIGDAWLTNYHSSASVKIVANEARQNENLQISKLDTWIVGINNWYSAPKSLRLNLSLNKSGNYLFAPEYHASKWHNRWIYTLIIKELSFLPKFSSNILFSDFTLPPYYIIRQNNMIPVCFSERAFQSPATHRFPASRGTIRLTLFFQFYPWLLR
jgi:hypothetical protein